MAMVWKSAGFVALTLAGTGHALAAPRTCESLSGLRIDHGTVTQAITVAPGAFVPPLGPPPPPPPPTPPGTAATPPGGGQAGRVAPIFATLPAFCKVLATLRPTADSEIKVEVWMPLATWNGNLQAIGNGAFNSTIQYNAMAQAIQAGYAAVGNNTGHEGSDSAFTIGHPERIVDWGSRAVHVSAVTAKAAAAAFYGNRPKFAYWNSCSTGGRQGWVAAQYYPADFDGIVAGDPANPMTRLQAGSIWANLAVNSDAASFITTAKWATIHDRVLADCDPRDGVRDGLIENPVACRFDTRRLLCADADTAACLTPAQVAALDKIVAGATNPRTGAQVYPGYPLGTAMLPGPVVGPRPDGSAPATFRMLFQNLDWDYRTFDFDRDVARSDALGNATINAADPARLGAFFARGGKFLMYHGWNDPAITPLASIALYDAAVAANGGKAKADRSIRLFMVPGMNHCAGGDGPNTFDKMAPLAAWVERGVAPDRIEAAHMTVGVADRTRPLCPYPQVARYAGAGSIDEAHNFTCVAPSRPPSSPS